MQIMWWGSYLQSLSSECFLRIRQSSNLNLNLNLSVGSLHSATFFKRLEVTESSTSESSSYADSWIRADYWDFSALVNWAQRAGKDSLAIVDLWAFAVQGRALSSVEQELEEVFGKVGHVIFLFPHVHVGGWIEAAGNSMALLQHLNILKSSYEFLLNLKTKFGLIQSSLTLKDFAADLDLDFSQARKWGGLIHVVPRDVVAGSLGFCKSSEICDGIMAMIEKMQQGARHGLVSHLRVERKESFEFAQGQKQTGTRWQNWLVRRADGVWALSAGWGLYLKTIAAPPVSLASAQSVRTAPKNPRSLRNEDRNFLIFMLRYEADGL